MFRAAMLGAIVVSSLAADPRSEAVARLLSGWNSERAPGCAIGVIQNGSLVFQSSFGQADLELGTPITAATPFNVASLSKQFTAAALYFLVESGRVHLTDPVRRFVPELPTYADSMTIADLLHHTSGLRDITPLLELGGRLGEPPGPEASLKLLAAQSALNFAPGTDYGYTNSGYLLLGIIIERVSGESLAEFAWQHIFQPLGMSSSGFRGGAQSVTGRATGYAARGAQFRKIGFPLLMAGDGGLFTSIEDLARWDRNFESGAVGGKAFLEFMQERGELRGGERIPYASGLIVNRYGGLPAIGHNGRLPGFRSEMLRFPTQHLTVACLCNRGDVDTSGLARTIARIYLGSKFHRPHPPDDLDYVTSGFVELSGCWESRQGWIVRMWSAVDSLSVELPEGIYRLYPLNRRQLYAEESGVRLVLTRLPDDQVELRWDGDPPVRYTRLPAKMPRRSELPGFAGAYRSSDADTRYQIRLENGALVVATPAGWRIPLEAAGPDRFLLGPWSAHFVRSADGTVGGLELHHARLWNLRFDKVDATGYGPDQ